MLRKLVKVFSMLVLSSSLLALGGCRSKGSAHSSAASASASLNALTPASAEQDKTACNEPDPAACFERAKDFELGAHGQKIDKEAAIALYQAACTRKEANACAELGPKQAIARA
ncbi:MAG: hypothetical protein ABIQ16_06475 [Polyangiaceae bacterium]